MSYRMTDQMQTALGYDMYGNCARLVCSADRIPLSRVTRASGDVVCRACNVLYRLHPAVQGALWATRTCEGIVKL